MKRNHTVVVECFESEQRRWVKAAGIPWLEWKISEGDSEALFQRWVCRVLNAAVRSGKGK